MPFVYKITTAYFSLLSSQTLWSTSGSHDWLGRPALIKLANSTWVLFYRSATAHGVADGEIHIRFSINEGADWSDEDKTVAGAAVTGFPVTAQGAVNDTGGPTAIQLANGDIIMLTYDTDTPFVREGTHQYRSTDNGATWAYEFKVEGDDELIGASMVQVGSTLYALLWRDVGTIDPPYSVEIHESDDDGATWALLSTVIGTGTGVNESGLVYQGGSNLLVVARSDSEAATYIARSTNLGTTWSSPQNYTSQLGVVQKPVLKYFGSRLYLAGRNRVTEFTSNTGLWHSDDDGDTWQGPFLPTSSLFEDSGYVDILQRENGQIVMISYEGTNNAASLVEYVIDVLR